MKKVLLTSLLVAMLATPATAGVWTTSCRYDDFEQYKSCAVVNEIFSVVVLEDGQGITFGYDHHPGTNLSVRVDDNPVIRWRANSHPSDIYASILEQMKGGEVLRGRYYRWPNKERVDTAVTLVGFEKAFAEAQAYVSAGN